MYRALCKSGKGFTGLQGRQDPSGLATSVVADYSRWVFKLK
jgi:hypothetical protein